MEIKLMTEAKEVNAWVYEKPYDLYSFSEDKEDMDELLDGSYYSCYDANGELVGYFCYGKAAQVPGGQKAELYNGDNTLDIGLGMKPSLVGQGMGKKFLRNGLSYGKEKFNPQKFRLSVATFNKRAIALYESLGFKKGQCFYSNEVEFILMECEEDL